MSAIERFWLQQYPAGVPADIDPTSYESLKDLLEEAFRRHGAQPAYSCMGATLTYRQLDEESAAVGAWLQSRGLGPGAPHHRAHGCGRRRTPGCCASLMFAAAATRCQRPACRG